MKYVFCEKIMHPIFYIGLGFKKSLDFAILVLQLVRQKILVSFVNLKNECTVILHFYVRGKDRSIEYRLIKLITVITRQ